MIENLKIRITIILAVVALTLIWVAPNFINVGEHWWFSKAKINYGLDIQGGLHLVMGVDVDGVIKEKTQRMVTNLPTEFKEQPLPFQSVKLSPDDHNKIDISVATPEQGDAIVEYLGKYYPSTLQVLEKTDSHIYVQFYAAKILEYKKQIISQAIEVIRNRIDEFGVSEPNIAAQGDDRIIVQLPGIKDANRAKELINRTARLSFRPIDENVSSAELAKWIQDAEKSGKYELGKDNMRYSAYVKRINEDLKSKIPPNTRIVFQKNSSAVNLETGKIPYIIKTDNDLTGDLLEDASVRPDQYGKPEVVFQFGVEGRRRFAKMTEENVHKRVAIVLDDIIQSAPVIQEKIDSATARITLNERNYKKAMDEAGFIATALRAGALPAAMEQLEERTVGPSLGKDSIDKGKFAGLIGSVLVVLFMLIYYKALGVIADLALTLNILMILAILTSLGATLTLPGVAGIVLTVGMAVDANVIIFERIREEIAKGASFKVGVKEGFQHAFTAIFDSNITTVAACIVLMYLGTGPVRGFAVTLVAGITTSMFTSIFVSRTLIDFLLQKMKFEKLSH